MLKSQLSRYHNKACNAESISSGIEIDRALKESQKEGGWNPYRDLILLREGIDNYRYQYALEETIARAGPKRRDHPPVAAARKFFEELRADVSPDVPRYDTARSGAYGENCSPRLDNPWTVANFAAVRRATAEHILTIGKLAAGRQKRVFSVQCSVFGFQKEADCGAEPPSERTKMKIPAMRRRDLLRLAIVLATLLTSGYNGRDASDVGKRASNAPKRIPIDESRI